MADIELVIKISKELYRAYKDKPPMLGDVGMDMIAQAIANGTPPKTGHWKPFDLTYGRSIFYCTACGESAEIPICMDEPLYKYCPNCGARMESED